MAAKTKHNSIQSVVQSTSRIHLLYILIYAMSIVIFDTWNLITHEGIAQRWTLAGTAFIVNIVVWYLARLGVRTPIYYKLLVLCLIVTDIIFASVNVYWERGMSSRSVMLYTVPIIVSYVLASRKALLATSAVCASAYVMTVTRYFHQHYGEGYKVELYGVTFFYAAIFFVLAWFLTIPLRSKG